MFYFREMATGGCRNDQMEIAILLYKQVHPHTRHYSSRGKIWGINKISQTLTQCYSKVKIHSILILHNKQPMKGLEKKPFPTGLIFRRFPKAPNTRLVCQNEKKIRESLNYYHRYGPFTCTEKSILWQDKLHSNNLKCVNSGKVPGNYDWIFVHVNGS